MKMKALLLIICCFLSPIVVFGQVNVKEKQMPKKIPRNILQKSRELGSNFIYYPAPFKRVAAVKHLGKNKLLGNFSVLTDEVAKDLVGSVP